MLTITPLVPSATILRATAGATRKLEIDVEHGCQTFASRARQTGSNGAAEDIALGIVFLASDDAGFMIGSGRRSTAA